MRTLSLLALTLTLAACGPNQAAYDRALDRPVPPDDFWVAVTVLGPARSTGYTSLPRAERPGRYVIESDRVLRAAQGAGADEAVFPPQLRTLSDEQWTRVWDALRSTSLSHGTSHDISKASKLLDAPEKTVIIVSYVAEGTRKLVAVDLGTDDPEAKAEALKIADTMADLAWLK